MKKPILIFMMTINIFANQATISLESKKSLEIKPSEKATRSIDLLQTIIREDIAKKCEQSINCIKKEVQSLELEIKNKIDSFEINSDETPSSLSGKSLKGMQKEGGWNFEGRLRGDFNLLVSIIVDEYMQAESDLSITEYIEEVFLETNI